MFRQQPCPSERYWKVEEGDTLYHIALQTGTTVAQILEINPQVTPSNILIGTLLCLPSVQPCPSGLYWRVSPGDTLYIIARANKTTVEKLLELNPGINPRNLQIDYNICLPG